MSKRPIEETEYEIVAVDEYVGDWPQRRDAVLTDTDTGNRELWREADDDAEHTIVIDGVGFEFMCTLETN